MSDENRNIDDLNSEKKGTNSENSGSKLEEGIKTKDALKKHRSLLILVLAILIVGVAIGIFAYVNSPAQRIKRALSTAERYMQEMDFTEAVSHLRTALEIDPQNPDVVVTVTEHVNRILTAADEKNKTREYEEELVIASAVNEFEYKILLPAETQERIEKTHRRAKGYKKVGKEKDKADDDFDKGEYDKARNEYEDIIGEDGVSENVIIRLDVIDIHSDFMEWFSDKDWEKIAECIDSERFQSVIRLLDDNNTLILRGEPGILIRKEEEFIYVIIGVSDDGIINNTAIALVSSVNTFAVYEGGWQKGQPEGEGTLTIWNKNEEMTDAVILTGQFKTGLLDGIVSLSNEVCKNILITTENGKVDVLTDMGDNPVYIADLIYVDETVQISNGHIDKYEAGLPGFGGTDRKLYIKVKDTVPPELSCDFTIGGKYHSSDVHHMEKHVTAIDDVDGEITRKVMITEDPCPKFGRIIAYKVDDRAGNQSTMIVRFDTYDIDCGADSMYKCLSIEVIKGTDILNYEDKMGGEIKVKEDINLHVYSEPNFFNDNIYVPVSGEDYYTYEVLNKGEIYQYSELVNGFYHVYSKKHDISCYVWHDFCEKL